MADGKKDCRSMWFWILTPWAYGLMGVAGLAALSCAPDAEAPTPETAETPASEAPATENHENVWLFSSSGTENTLRGLSAAGDGVVWVTGSKGTVLRSIDDGATFEPVPPPGTETYEIRDVEAWSADVAVLQVAGQPARFYRTTDGGQTYETVYEHPSDKAFFDGFAFWPADDRARGIAYSDPVDGQFVVAVTEDQGQSWTTLDGASLPAAREGEAGFAASGTGIAVAPGGSVWIGMGGPSARILYSTDYGKTWAFSDSTLRRGEPSAGVFSIAFKDPQIGFAMGGDYRDEEGLDGTLALSTDGGVTWTAGSGLTGFRSCVVWMPNLKDGDRQGAWVAAGPLGADLSFDDGTTWTELGDQGFHVLSRSPEGNLWAAGAEGKIARLNR